MRKEIPAGVLEMLAVPGLRPDKVLKLYKELRITSAAQTSTAPRIDGEGINMDTPPPPAREPSHPADGFAPNTSPQSWSDDRAGAEG